jgi:phenylalanyl-tRNA synthetase beta chain
MSGLEVEEMKMLAPPFSKIVIAEILEATQHPDADRLRVCKVNVGEIDGVINPLQIVCGAPNARVGIKIPCALVGAVLPPSEPDGKPFLIKIGKLRGVESFGMLCSGKELGLGDDHAGIYELPIDAPVGKNIRDYLNLDDTLFTIKLTPNKADCLSVMGIARDLSAVTGSAFMPNSPSIIKSTIDDKLKIRVEEPELCGRFSGRVMRGVNAKVPTPQWMVSRLASAGQRSISALVDISNYVMLEVGQPTHVFDLHKIQGDITVRWGHPGESVKLLNGQTIQISDIKQKIGVITSGNEIESLAGIMGGDHTAVNLDTTDIFVESAYWLPNAIQGRARELSRALALHRLGGPPAVLCAHLPAAAAGHAVRRLVRRSFA